MAYKGRNLYETSVTTFSTLDEVAFKSILEVLNKAADIYLSIKKNNTMNEKKTPKCSRLESDDFGLYIEFI